MSDYGVYGKKGTGKSKFAVWRAQQALRAGRRVASNLDLHLDKLVPEKRTHYVRVPDRPLASDLEALGKGSDGPYDEERFGVLILDELATWLNARTFSDKDRARLIDWLVHARKLRWDVYYLVQGLEMIDKQVRGSLVEYEVRMMRMDKVRIPVIGRALSLLHKPLGYFPKFHMACARVGVPPQQFVAERWNFFGKDLHAGYDTEQVFDAHYPHGVHSVLPPWGFNPPLPLIQRLRLQWQAMKQPPAPIPLKPKLRLVGLLEVLPPAERVSHVRRLERLGLLNAPAVG